MTIPISISIKVNPEILTSKKLNEFEDISYSDVAAIYANLKSGIGVQRGFKGL